MKQRLGWLALFGVLTVFGCAPESPLLADGNIKSNDGYEIIRPPGMNDQAFVAQYQECVRSEGPRGFPSACMQAQGSSLLLPNGIIMPSTMESARKSRSDNCEAYSQNFTEPMRAFNLCIAYVGKNITLANGRVVPAMMAFNYALVLQQDSHPPAPQPRQAQPTAADDDSGPHKLVELLKGWLVLQGLALARNHQSTGTAPAPASSGSAPLDDYNPFAPTPGNNYLRCGNMYGC